MFELAAALPKAELHIHVEGSLEPEMVFALAERNGLTSPDRSVADLRRRYAFGDLASFLRLYYECMAVLVTRRDFAELTEAYLRRAVATAYGTSSCSSIRRRTPRAASTSTRHRRAAGRIRGRTGRARPDRRSADVLPPGPTGRRGHGHTAVGRASVRRPARGRPRFGRGRLPAVAVSRGVRRRADGGPAARRPRRRGGPAGVRTGGARRAGGRAHRPRRPLTGGPGARGAAVRRPDPVDRLPAVQPPARRGSRPGRPSAAGDVGTRPARPRSTPTTRRTSAAMWPRTTQPSRRPAR